MNESKTHRSISIIGNDGVEHIVHSASLQNLYVGLVIGKRIWRVNCWVKQVLPHCHCHQLSVLLWRFASVKSSHYQLKNTKAP